MATDTSEIGGSDSFRTPDWARAEGPLDALAELCFPLYQRLFAPRRDFVREVEAKLDEALRDTTVELYLSRAIAIGVLVGFFSALVGVTVGYVTTTFLVGELPTVLDISGLSPDVIAALEAAKAPAFVTVVGLAFGALGFSLGFGAPILTLYHEAYERERQIGRLLPDTISFMYALSLGGMNHIEILRTVADAEEVYGEVSREFQTVVQETDYFDVDYRTAIHNRAVESPSEPLGQFFTDMLSIVNSGGDMTQFLDEQSDRHLRIAQQNQEETLDMLELLGEMYLAISLFPLLLIILLVVMSLVGQTSTFMLYVAVYGLIPLIGLLFFILIAMIKQDEQTSGYLTMDGSGEGVRPGTEAMDGRETQPYRDRHTIFARMDRREQLYRFAQRLRNPHEFFIQQPLATLAATVPLTLLYLGAVFLLGIGPESSAAFVNRPFVGTLVYVCVPLYILALPLTVFHELYTQRRYGVLGNLTETLRKLSSANDTGLTLLESFRTVAETSTGRLADDFDRIYLKVTYGTRLKRALYEFSNQYHVPRLARLVKLVAESQETSSRITQVLTTAASASENQDEIARSRKTRTQMQIAIIVMTFLTLLGVMAILKVQFVGVLADIVSSGDSTNAPSGLPSAGNVNVDLLSMLFLHAVILQAVSAGFISGYLRDADLLSGTKYLVALVTVALLVWGVVA